MIGRLTYGLLLSAALLCAQTGVYPPPATGGGGGGGGTTYSNGTGLGLSGSTFSVLYGTTNSTSAVGNDSRFLNATSLNGVPFTGFSGFMKWSNGAWTTATASDYYTLFGYTPVNPSSLGTAASQSASAFSLLGGYLSNTYTVGSGGVTAGTIIQFDSSANAIAATGGYGGIATTTKAQGASVEVARLGVASCVFENAAVIGDIAIPGTTNKTNCRDSGVTTSTAVSTSTSVIGLIQSAATAGSTASIRLHGVGIFGTMIPANTYDAYNAATTAVAAIPTSSSTQTNPALITPTDWASFNSKLTGTLPAISNVVSSPSSSTIAMSWNTDIASDSSMQCGTTSGTYPINAADAHAELNVTSHQAIVAGLNASTTYYCIATSTAYGGGTSKSSPVTVATSAYAASTAISNFSVASWSQTGYSTLRGDTFYNAVCSDNNTYFTMDDTTGYSAAITSNMAIGKFTSETTFSGTNINALTGFGTFATNVGSDAGGHTRSNKLSGLMCTGGTMYALAGRQNNSNSSGYPDSGINGLFNQRYGQLMKSPDLGATWTTSQQPSTAYAFPPNAPNYSFNYFTDSINMGSPTFVMYGSDDGTLGYFSPTCNATSTASTVSCRVDNADAYAYIVSTDGYWNNGSKLFLARIAKAKMKNMSGSDVQYYTNALADGNGLEDGNWSSSSAGLTPILTGQGILSYPNIQYIPYLNRYMLLEWGYANCNTGSSNAGCPTTSTITGNTFYQFYDAPHPWGPYTSVGTIASYQAATGSGFGSEPSGSGLYNPAMLQRSALTATGVTSNFVLLSGGNFQSQPSWYTINYANMRLNLPAPAAPTAFTSSGITSTAATVGWTATVAFNPTYKVFRSTTNGFTPGAGNQIATGLTAVSYNDSGLSAGTTYYYAVQALTSGGTSTSLTGSLTTTSSGSGPVISAVTATAASTTSETITWTTDVASTSTVAYGSTSSYGSSLTGSDGVTSHSVTLTGLTAGTTYHYQVTSISDGNSISSSSTDGTFTTTAATALLLDSVCPGSTCPQGGAWSVARQLRTAYTGNIITIRRAIDSTTTNIGVDGSGNTNASAISTFCSGTTCGIDTIYDQTGAGFNLSSTSTTVANECIVYASSAVVTNAGHTACQFNSSSTSQQYTTGAVEGSVLNTLSAEAMAVATMSTGNPGYSSLIEIVDGVNGTGNSTQNAALIMRNATAAGVTIYHDNGTGTAAVGSAGITYGTPFFADAKYNNTTNSNKSSMQTGTTVVTSSVAMPGYTTNLAANQVTLGNELGSTSSYWIGYFSESYVWNVISGLTTTFHTNLSSYYGVP